MPKRSSTRRKDHLELSRKVLDSAAPDADEDRVPAVEDRVPAADDRVPAAEDRVSAAEDRVPAAEDQGPKKNPAAVALGRLGGLKGGKARAAKLTAERRSEIARKAAEARWNKEDD